MEKLDKEILQYAARHIQEAIDNNCYVNINPNTIEIEMFDVNNMTEGSTLKVRITVGESK